MLHTIGKMLELSAMILLMFGLAVGLMEEHGMGKELTLLAVGSVLFYVGYLMEQRGGAGPS